MSREARLSNPDDVLEVVAGVIRSPNGQILLSQRAAKAHQGGLWEFPGGKLEAGESLVHALGRELEEELGIVVVECQPLISVLHPYLEYTVRLNVFDVTAWDGTPNALEGQNLKWCEESDLPEQQMPAADKPVISAICLPEYYPITPPGPPDHDWWQQFQQLLDAEYRLLQLRVKGLPHSAMRETIEKAARLAEASSCKVILNGTIDWVEEHGFAGAHLTSGQLMSLRSRPLKPSLLLGASCHNLLELRRAEQIGADWACLSPVRHTLSHPEASAIGLEAFSELVSQVNIPVFALGGLGTNDVSEIRAIGGQGVAGISAFLR